MTKEHKLPPIDNNQPRSLSPPWKSGIRVLGVAESFNRDDKHSIVAGIVMRGDFRIDGFGICRPTIGGMDSTSSLISLFDRLERPDIRGWMLGGSIISWFNIVNIKELAESTGIPVVSVSYRPSDGIVKYLKEYFPKDWAERERLMNSIGPRTEVMLDTGHSVFLTFSGITRTRAKQLVNQFTLDGRIPEPIRVARIHAAGLHRDLERS